MTSKRNKEQITFLGRLNFREERARFGIKRADRRYHTYIIGQTGTGKTTLMESMILQDMENGEGLALLDPHGDMTDRLMQQLPEARRKDVIYLNVPDLNCEYGFNPLASVPEERRPLAAAQMIDALKRIWEKTWGPRMEHMLRNSLMLLLDQPNSSLADIRRLFFDSAFVRQALMRLKNPEVRDFWIKEFPAYSIRFRNEAINPILNKLSGFLTTPSLYRVLVGAKENLDVRQLMDQGKILLVNLAKGKLGPENTSLLGALLTSRIGLSALSRADQQEDDRRDFYLYMDEFQNFTTMSTTAMLSEVRKYHLSLILGHQYLDQVEPEITSAIIGNVGTIIAFRVGFNDARVLEKVFYPKFDANDLINLANYSIYLRLMIDGKVSAPFSAETLPTIPFALRLFASMSQQIVVLLVQARRWFWLRD